MIKFLSELAPLIAFFTGYKIGGIQLAAIYMIIVSAITILLTYIIYKKVQKGTLIAAIILLISTTLSISSGNTIFIKMKPTIVYIIFALVLIVSAMKDRPVLKYALGEAVPMDLQSWQVLSYRFSWFFSAMAIVNELIWRNFDEVVWVNFKVFGALPVTIIFVMFQIPFILKNKLN